MTILPPGRSIIKFFKQHHVFALTTCVNNVPWSCSCFYALIEDETALVFTSGYETRHVAEAQQNKQVAGVIVLETKIIGKIKGIQFSGRMELATGKLLETAKKAYLKRFPFTALMGTTLWLVFIDYLKMTDNNLGFGKKLVWERDKALGSI
jgi:uncharacterized protein YhbP (UPF0306 family)